MVVVVAELVMDGDEVLGRDVDAHLDAQVVHRSRRPTRSRGTRRRGRAGFVKSDRSQNVSGSGSKPSDVKKRLAELHHLLRRSSCGS